MCIMKDVSSCVAGARLPRHFLNSDYLHEAGKKTYRHTNTGLKIGSHSHWKTGGIQMRTSLLGRRARAASTMPLSRPSGRRREIGIEDIVNLRAEEVNVRKKGKG